VRVDAVLSITFSEVVLEDFEVRVTPEIFFELAYRGERVELVPIPGLSYGKTYTVALANVSDRLGNVLRSYEFTFATVEAPAPVAPVAEFRVYQGASVAHGERISLTVRIAGDFWARLDVRVSTGAEEVANETLLRVPGEPTETTIRVALDIAAGAPYKLTLAYVPHAPGASPLWLTVSYREIEYNAHFVFQSPEAIEKTLNLTEILDFMIRVCGLAKLDASQAYDPDGELESYVWVLGDGTHVEGIVVYHFYERAGTYTVELTVADTDGYSDTCTKTVNVSDVLPAYSAYRGAVAVSLQSAVDLHVICEDKPDWLLHEEHAELENKIPNSEAVRVLASEGSELTVCVLPPEAYVYTLTGRAEGTYLLASYHPGDYRVPDWRAAPVSWPGERYELTAEATEKTLDVVAVDVGAGLSVRVQEDAKFYSLRIARGSAVFEVADVSVKPGATHTYEVTDWEKLADVSAAAVSLRIDEQSDNVIEKVVSLRTGQQGSELLKPDLYVEGVVLEGEPREGETLRVHVELGNKGEGHAREVAVEVWVGEHCIGVENISRITAGERASASFAWTAAPGHHNIRIVVDPADMHDEPVEADNVYETRVTVGRAEIVFKMVPLLVLLMVIVVVVFAELVVIVRVVGKRRG
jgi:PKD repeat protein